MPRNRSTFGVYRRALQEARRYWWHLGLVLFLGLLAAPLALLTPLPIKIIVDNVLGGEALPPALAWLVPGQWSDGVFAVALALTVVIALLAALHQAVEWLFREYVAERMVVDFRGKLFAHALRSSLLHHFTKGSHEPAYRISLDAPAIQWTALYGIIPVVVSLASLGAMLYVTWRMAPAMALVALATAVPMLLLIHFNQHRMRGKWHEVREEESAAQNVVQESLGALRLVTVFGQEQRELDRFMVRAMRGLSTRLRVIRTESVFNLLMGTAVAGGTATILYLGVNDVRAGNLTTGELLLIVGYIGQLYAPLQAIGGHLTGQQQAIASAERVFNMLDEKSSVPERPDALPLERARGEFEFHDCGFSYQGKAPVFSAVRQRIPAGSRVGVIGPSGAGKSTLVNLLLRLFDPTEGQIRLDGTDLRDYRLADLRNQFSVVSQEVALFSASIADNIAYARPDATREEVVAAARMSRADAFISRLPQGYDTLVGEGGMLVSGGERQRLALARAFLKNAPILLLDEPTSALDRVTEHAIADTLDELMEGRTVFIIAHNQGVVRNVDFVLKVGDGRVSLEDPDSVSLLKAS